MDLVQIQQQAQDLLGNLERVILGKREAIELLAAGLLARGHILIEDVPGVGKTMLARALAQSLGAEFRRIQFTPDLLPSDITGSSVFNQQTSAFEFHPGPLMTNIVLADEINRATPKTQSALLEAMEERQLTIDGATRPLPDPFLVIATQNPIEYEGTFPLPEAQLDRFLLKISLGYLSPELEIEMIDRQQFEHPIQGLRAVLSREQVLAMQQAVRGVHVSEPVKQYIVALTSATRQDESVYLGASPRGALSLFRAGQAIATLRGREYVLPDDVKAVAGPVLAHRIIVDPAVRMHQLAPMQVVEQVLQRTPLPDAELS